MARPYLNRIWSIGFQVCILNHLGNRVIIAWVIAIILAVEDRWGTMNDHAVALFFCFKLHVVKIQVANTKELTKTFWIFTVFSLLEYPRSCMNILFLFLKLIYLFFNLFLLNFIVFCNLFYMKIPSRNTSYMFDRLIEVGSCFFFQSHLLILDWLRIMFCIFFSMILPHPHDFSFF